MATEDKFFWGRGGNQKSKGGSSQKYKGGLDQILVITKF